MQVPTALQIRRENKRLPRALGRCGVLYIDLSQARLIPYPHAILLAHVLAPYHLSCTI